MLPSNSSEGGTSHLILLAEDNLDDAFLIRKAVEKAGALHAVKHVRDGHEAVLYLSRALVDRTMPRPTCALLDIQTPRKSGLEVLSWIRTQRPYAGMPVAILTSSRRPDDIARAKKLGVHSYIIKSVEFQEVVEFVGRPLAAH